MLPPTPVVIDCWNILSDEKIEVRYMYELGPGIGFKDVLLRIGDIDIG